MVKRILFYFSLFFLVGVSFWFWGYFTSYEDLYPNEDIKRTFRELKGVLKSGHIQEEKNNFDFRGFAARDTTFIDPGYLLISRFSREHDQVIVDLYRIRDFKLLYRWIPPIKKIITIGNKKETTGDLHLRKADFQVKHPLLLEDGSIVFSHGNGYLARIDKDSQVLWVNSHDFHHSIERGADGNLVATININPSSVNYRHWLDHGYSILSLEGKIIETRSITQILLDNGFKGLLITGKRNYRNDIIHLNDAQPIHEDNKIAKRGDIAFSMRNISTVAIYRPGENKIVALKFGPWLNQHDINILPDGRFSIFNNYSVTSVSNSGGTLSNVLIWDPVSGSVESPYEEILKQVQMSTGSQGRSRILPNGDVFVEETDRSRILRVSTDKVRWEYVNASEEAPKITGALHWSRYYMPDEIPLKWLEITP